MTLPTPEDIAAEVPKTSVALVKRYRKKSIVIEAMQSDGTPESNRAIIDWTRGSATPAYMDKRAPAFDLPEEQCLSINTLEGAMWVDPGDWIIRGVKGEHYPCKPDIFAATYEPATALEATMKAPAADAGMQVLLKEAAQYVRDAGTDEDGETQQHSTALLVKIDAALASAPQPAASEATIKAEPTFFALQHIEDGDIPDEPMFHSAEAAHLYRGDFTNPEAWRVISLYRHPQAVEAQRLRARVIEECAKIAEAVAEKASEQWSNATEDGCGTSYMGAQDAARAIRALASDPEEEKG